MRIQTDWAAGLAINASKSNLVFNDIQSLVRWVIVDGENPVILPHPEKKVDLHERLPVMRGELATT